MKMKVTQTVEQELRAIIAEALEPGVFGYQDRSSIVDAELDEIVERIGNAHGYGALMDSASRMWRKKLEPQGMAGGEKTVAACAVVRQDWCKRAAAAIKRK